MPAAALNAFHTIYLRHLLKNASGDHNAYSINVNIHPLPRTDDGEVWCIGCAVISFIKHLMTYQIRIYRPVVINEMNMV